MSFEADLKSHLQGDASIVALVADRIYPGIVEEGANRMPAVVYSLPFGAPENCLDGFTSGVSSYEVQLDCYALTYDETIRLALAVRDRMATAAAQTFACIVTQFPLIDDYEPDTKRYRRSIGCSVKFKEYA